MLVCEGVMVLVIDGEEVDPGANMKAMFDNVAQFLVKMPVLSHIKQRQTLLTCLVRSPCP